jgi:hypothetical protein
MTGWPVSAATCGMSSKSMLSCVVVGTVAEVAGTPAALMNLMNESRHVPGASAPARCPDAERVRHPDRDDDVVAGSGHERLFAAPHGQPAVDHVEAVGQVRVKVQRRAAPGAMVISMISGVMSSGVRTTASESKNQ